MLNTIQTDVSKVQSIASPLQVVVDTEPGKAIRQTISAIVDGIPALLKVLDDVAQIHPFIKSSCSWPSLPYYFSTDVQQSPLAHSESQWSWTSSAGTTTRRFP